MKRKNKHLIRLSIGGAGLILLGGVIFPTSRLWILGRMDTLVANLGASSEASPTSLREENAQLEAEVSSLLYLKRENQRLREALNIQNKADIQKYVPARVVSRADSNYLRHSVQLDVGSAQGVAKGQAVIHHGFVVGTVAKVKNNQSRVQLLTDPESRIAVRLNNEAQSKGVLKSPFGVELTIDLVPQKEQVSPDTRVFTSGTDGLPDGLPLGTIGAVEDSQTQYYTLYLDTPVDFQKIRNVFVIIPS